ncbi:MAG: UbiX family flavin prenyltransferase [Neisseriaceae bacterium]|nr:UbiX family flavin prenyltransferase [Neisseriaceae bacterium]MBQ9724023.1 UbiX family flavin prenyltransferase [Neisseriaceae bacterium]
MFSQYNQEKSIILAITGASGIPYARRLLQCLIKEQVKVYLLYSSAAQIVARQECDWQLDDDISLTNQALCDEFQAACEQLMVVDKNDWFSRIASGSAFPDAMVVCPASMGCVAAIANGLSDNLIERAADVCLKEKKPLIIVPRETPFSLIHLRNLTRLAESGATILPPSPAFYHHPQTIDDMVNFVVNRILQHLNIKADNAYRWGD